MANIISYTPVGVVAKALFNFDAMGTGYSDFRITGDINVSISQPFMYSQYLNGFGNSSTWTPDVAAIYWNTTQLANINSMLSMYENFINVSFSTVIDSTAYSPYGAKVLTNSDINISLIYRTDLAFSGMSSVNRNAFNYTGSELDIILNVNGFGSAGVANDTSLSNSSYGFHTLMHELEHSLGLSHPHTSYINGVATLSGDFSATTTVGFDKLGFVISSDQDMNKEYFSIMSYDDERPVNGVNTFAQTPMILDVIALQDAYGVGGGSSGSGNDVITPGSSGSVSSYRTYFDVGGSDKIDLSNYASGAYFRMGESIVGASHLVGVSMSSSDAQLMNIGSDPQSLRWFYGEFENALGSAGNDYIIGNNLTNLIEGSNGADSLEGGDGNDSLYGGAGNDTFDWDSVSRAGNDTMYGGTGDDIYVVDSVSDSVVELSAEGEDVIWASFSYSLTSIANVEELNLFGSSNINATGNELANVIRGNSGNNVLTAGGGLDTFIFASSGNGLDVISDFSAGELIKVLGANFSSSVTSGNGSSVGLYQIQCSRAGGITTLCIGTDSSAGADIQIALTGNYGVDQFIDPSTNEGEFGIVAVHLTTPSGVVRLD